MTTQTLTALRQLKLGGMADALQSQLEQVGTYEGLPLPNASRLLVEHEYLSRDQRKQERLIRQARFKLRCLRRRTIDYQHPRNITPSQIAQLGPGRLDPSWPEPVDHRPLRQRQDLSRLRPRPQCLSAWLQRSLLPPLTACCWN